jgi:2-C-methyl-D-erythritol 4-phosphate cytidylyltransferase
MAHPEEYAIIVAGGKGMRMQKSIPKQFIEINGLPVLMHTIRAFHDYSSHIKIILVLPGDELFRWNELCKKHNFNIPHTQVTGGENRSASVQNGLACIKDEEGLVAIHDGVRPLVSKKTIRQSFLVAAQHGNAIAAIPLKDSIRKITDGQTQTVNREDYRMVQTPQTFKVKNIKEAYSKVKEIETDDAGIAEKAGQVIHLIEGEYENIKITTPEDIHVAVALLKTRTSATSF